MKTDCFVCQKHASLETYTGTMIAESDGIALTHFPFLPDEKASRGRLIVEPIRHAVEASELTLREASALGLLIQSGITRLKEKLKAEHVYVFRINDKVAHLHFHLVPRFANVPKEFWGLKIFEWPDATILDLAEIKKTALLLK